MAVSRKGVLLFIALFLASGLILVLGPVAACAYRQYAFAKNIRVQIDVPSCLEGTPASKPCIYIFSFTGERDSYSIQFEGRNLRHEYDARKNAFSVTGLGLITHHQTIISLTSSQVLVNGQPLPAGQAPLRVLVNENGNLVSGYCEPRW